MRLDELRLDGYKGGLAARFWSKVERGADCWEWQGAKMDGYGYIRVQFTSGALRAMRAHRVAWLMANGDLRDDLLIAHRCDNPSCVNPSHLFLATCAENVADMDRKGRRRVRGYALKRAQLASQGGDLIRFLRGDLTQQAFADRVGVEQSTVAGWESGSRSPNKENISRLRALYPQHQRLIVDVLLAPAERSA